MTYEDCPELRVRLAGPDDLPSRDVDAVVRSEWVDERTEHAFCELRVVVVPGSDEVELLVASDTEPAQISRLRRLVEFDIAMARRFSAATDGRFAPRIDHRVAELSGSLGDDAVRVAARGLVCPGGGESEQPTLG